MEGLIYLIPVALLLGLAGLGAFLWALKSGQFDDLDGAAERILLDEEDVPHPEAPESKVETTGPAEPPRRS